jgi:hypothetical protein
VSRGCGLSGLFGGSFGGRRRDGHSSEFYRRAP